MINMKVSIVALLVGSLGRSVYALDFDGQQEPSARMDEVQERLTDSKKLESKIAAQAAKDALASRDMLDLVNALVASGFQDSKELYALEYEYKPADSDFKYTVRLQGSPQYLSLLVFPNSPDGKKLSGHPLSNPSKQNMDADFTAGELLDYLKRFTDSSGRLQVAQLLSQSEMGAWVASFPTRYESDKRDYSILRKNLEQRGLVRSAVGVGVDSFRAEISGSILALYFSNDNLHAGWGRLEDLSGNHKLYLGRFNSSSEFLAKDYLKNLDKIIKQVNTGNQVARDSLIDQTIK